MASNQDPKRIIEELKAAGEELKKASLQKSGQKDKRAYSTERRMEEIPRTGPFFAKPTGSKAEIDLLKKIGQYRKELSQERLALERTYQEVKEWEKKIEGRLELLKKLEDRSREMNKEFNEFQEQLTLAKKENSNLLNQIKDKLGRKENE